MDPLGNQLLHRLANHFPNSLAYTRELKVAPVKVELHELKVAPLEAELQHFSPARDVALQPP